MSEPHPYEALTREQLLALLADYEAQIQRRWADTSLMQVDSTEEGMAAYLQSPFGSMLTHFCITLMKQENAPNFIGLDVEHPEDGAFTFTIQRKGGLTPARMLNQVRAERDALQDKLDILTDLVRKTLTESPEDLRRKFLDTVSKPTVASKDDTDVRPLGKAQPNP